MKAAGLAAVVTAAGAAILGLGLVAHADGTTPAVLGTPVVTGCAIRFDSTGPRIHENSTHSCTGANSVSVEADGDLLIRSDPHGPIVSMTIEEDETLSQRGITAGPSGGSGTTVVRFYSSKTGMPVRADSTVLQGSYANIWVTWVHAG